MATPPHDDANVDEVLEVKESTQAAPVRYNPETSRLSEANTAWYRSASNGIHPPYYDFLPAAFFVSYDLSTELKIFQVAVESDWIVFIPSCSELLSSVYTAIV